MFLAWQVAAIPSVLSLVALFYVFVIVVVSNFVYNRFCVFIDIFIQRNVVWRIRHIHNNWNEKLRVFHQPMDLLIV